MTTISAQDIDKLLPQTQCGECGYPGCLPYAQALAAGLATIDHCPPGGVKTLKALGALLEVDPTPYLNDMQAKSRPPALAVIQEAECIGCTKCIQACPVDAIVGGAKLMHTIIPYECTGCGLCVAPCPVDCIEMVALPEVAVSYDKAVARGRFNAKKIRQLQDEQLKQQQYREKSKLAETSSQSVADKRAKQAYILEAMQRIKAKKTHE